MRQGPMVSSIILSIRHKRLGARVDLGPQHYRIEPYVKSPKSGILVTEVITFDKIAPWVILGRS